MAVLVRFFPLIPVIAIFLQNDGWVNPAAFPALVSVVAVVTAIRGAGAYLLGRREAGFLKAFVSHQQARLRCVLAQSLSGFTFAMIVVALFAALTSVFFPAIGPLSAVAVAARLCGFALLVGLAGTALNLVPFKYQTVFSAVTATFPPMFLLAMAA